jgi:hypothetical protein
VRYCRGGRPADGRCPGAAGPARRCVPNAATDEFAGGLSGADRGPDRPPDEGRNRRRPGRQHRRQKGGSFSSRRAASGWATPTRLLAIARRLDRRAGAGLRQPRTGGRRVFDAFGYHAEYIPPRRHRRGFADWDRGSHELSEIIDRYDPAVVVFDGNNPTDGLVRAALTHGACRLVWVRRGMCPAKPLPYLGNARFFDCVIEPGEYAAERDRGPRCAAPRGGAGPADPPSGRWRASVPRHRAQQLGLDPDRPAVLVQPGSGANRDIVDLTDRMVSQLSPVRRAADRHRRMVQRRDLAAALAGHAAAEGLPDQPLLRGFRFLGLGGGLQHLSRGHRPGPADHLRANRHPSMDGQGARAEFAQDRGAGFDLKEEEMHLFPTLCRAMLNPAGQRRPARRAAPPSTDQWRGGGGGDHHRAGGGRGMSGWNGKKGRRLSGPASGRAFLPHRGDL